MVKLCLVFGGFDLHMLWYEISDDYRETLLRTLKIRKAISQPTY
jgi:hypothetical protein